MQVIDLGVLNQNPPSSEKSYLNLLRSWRYFHLKQNLVNFVCKKPDSKYFQIVRFCCCSSHRQYINGWLSSNKVYVLTLKLKFHIILKYHKYFNLKQFEKEKILSWQAMQKNMQWTGFGLGAVICWLLKENSNQ